MPRFWKYPVFPLFAALVLAIAVAGVADLRAFSGGFALSAVFFAAAEVFAASLSFFGLGAVRARRLRRALLAACAFCGGAAYFYWRVPPNPRPDFPPTEVAFTGRIREVSESARGNLYGVLTVEKCGLDFLEGAQSWFMFANPKRGEKTEMPRLKRGDVVRARGSVKSVAENEPSAWSGRLGADNSFNKYLAGRFVYFKAFAFPENVRVVEFSREKRLGDLLAEHIKVALGANISAPYSAADTLESMFLGDKSSLTNVQKENFKKTGTMHIFAVSGLHMSIVALALYGICAVLRIPFKWRAAVALPVLFLYVAACQFPPSAVRAFIMVAAFWIAATFSRGSGGANSLMWSAVVSLLVSPTSLFSAGFQLSYSVVAALFLYSFPVFSEFENRFSASIACGKFFGLRRGIFSIVVGGLCMAMGSACVAMPISAYWFGTFSLSGVLLSPLFVSLATAAVFLAVLGVLLPSVAGGFFACAASFFAFLTDYSAGVFADNFAFMIDAKINSGVLCAFFVCLVFAGFAACAKLNIWLRFCVVPAIVLAVMVMIWIFA